MNIFFIKLGKMEYTFNWSRSLVIFVINYIDFTNNKLIIKSTIYFL